MKGSRPDAFSLVEVVTALAVVVFAGFALVGLLGVGVRNTQDSREQLQAATIAETICATRRAAPNANLTANGFPLPALSTSANNLGPPASPVALTWDGVTAPSTSDPSARFGLLYNIVAPASYVPSTSPGMAIVYLNIYWPAQAAPGSGAGGHFEVTTSFALP